jgi:predicted transcriptional regulator
MTVSSDNTHHDTDSDVLTRQLDAIAVAIERARTFEHEQRLGTHATRRQPGDMLRSLHRWQRGVTASAPDGGTVTHKSGAEGTAQRAASAGAQSTPSAHEELSVPVSPATSIRIPEELREQAEAFGRERRWSFGQTVRVGLEQLVGYHQDDDAEPRRAA